ncbi:hypothetical protein B0H16DRAFT_1725263 [Mycena metata]|uniref:Uncharacterized protein n=1 Tax=Mycena metata TaxID=1033252 RepID=A0AAD7IT56_9AGAR|nr:hypothetical protein B0H16DRAFT_1725263 [Mycena metata]
MSDDIIAFRNGNGVLITTQGPGRVHLISYASNHQLENVVGTIGTHNSGVTHFMISHSYTFTGFAFYWDGSGEAVFTIGDQPQTLCQPVGSSWTKAVNIMYGGHPTLNTDVSKEVPSAVERSGYITCFKIPNLS